MKVLISDKLSKDAVKCFSDNGIETDYKPGISPEELFEIIYKYEGLAIRSNTKVTKNLLSNAKNLNNW